MLQRNNKNGDANEKTIKGCGPLMSPIADNVRPLKQQIFELIRGEGLCARVDIANKLDVSPASVTTITNDLIASGFVREITIAREGEPVRGRPPVSIGVRGDSYHVAGIKLNDQAHTAVIVDFSGKIIADASIERQHSAIVDSKTVLEEAKSLLDIVLAKAGILPHQLAAVGLGIPGLVARETGVVVWSPILNEQNISLASQAERQLGYKTYIDNDANLVTLAELWFGKGREVSDFAVVTIEHGIGMGMVINHRIHRGAHGLGMELGHTKLQLDGALCRCGQRGCLEAYVADYALVREALTATNIETYNSLDNGAVLDALFAQARDGNQAARAIFARAGRFLAAGLSNVINLFDPSLIILAGARMQYDYLYADEVIRSTQNQVLVSDRVQPKIEVHTWGDLLWAHGAAALALSELTDQLLGNVSTTNAHAMTAAQ